MSCAQVHISSIVVHVDPTVAARVRDAMDGLPGVQTHAVSADSKFVVTVEAPSEGESIAQFETVRALPGVLAVSMVFHQFEADPDQEV